MAGIEVEKWVISKKLPDGSTLKERLYLFKIFLINQSKYNDINNIIHMYHEGGKLFWLYV
jgi:hypothetical protein